MGPAASARENEHLREVRGSACRHLPGAHSIRLLHLLGRVFELRIIVKTIIGEIVTSAAGRLRIEAVRRTCFPLDGHSVRNAAPG